MTIKLSALFKIWNNAVFKPVFGESNIVFKLHIPNDIFSNLNDGRGGNFDFQIEPVHEISNNVACATSKASDKPAHARSLIRDFASRLSIL